MRRDVMVDRAFEERSRWDLVIIGGGATGIGIAVDAASRGYEVCLIEQSDFGKGTSSRSTKLVHGGVRYLQQGNISLVMEALKERGLLRQNAPHLVTDLAFIVPNYDWWETPFYGVGMKVYDMLAGKYGFGRSRLLTTDETIARIPGLETDGLRGGVLYYDGQFDDARLLINLAQTAEAQGAVLLNHCRAVALTKDGDGFVSGVVAQELESGREVTLRARCVINATGCFSDAVRRLDDPEAEPMIAPSQGIHLVFDARFLAGKTAIMVPRTSDGRVLFAIPWHGRTVVGTTDTPISEVSLEPRPLREEIDFILETAAEYLEEDPTEADVRSVFTGIRPLVQAKGTTSTAALSRDHSIHISASGLLTIAGGKWTTYRRMAESCVNHASTLGLLEERPCITRQLNIHGHHRSAARHGDLAVYGSDASEIEQIARTHPELGERLHPDLPLIGAQVRWAVDEEMARTVEDVLARRTRCLLLDARASVEVAPKVASLMAESLGKDLDWQKEQLEAYREVAAVHRLDV